MSSVHEPVVESESIAGVSVLRLRGPLVTFPDTETLRQAVRHVLAATAQPVVLDLSKAKPVGASGMAALIVVQEDVRRAGRHLILLQPSANLRAMIDQLHLTPWVDVSETEASAIRRAIEWRPSADPVSTKAAAPFAMDRVKTSRES